LEILENSSSVTEDGLVSVIIPVYNGAKYLAESIDSALSQSYSKLEVVVIDDGSTDDSAAIAKSYGDRIVYLRKENAGTAAARNAGIRASRGEFVALLDQDDLWMPDHLQLEVQILQEPGVALAYSAVRLMGGKTMYGATELFAGAEVGLHQLLDFQTLPAATFVMRRRVLEELGFFDEELSGPDDWELSIRIATKYKLKGTSVITASIRLHGNNQGSNGARMVPAMRAVANRYRYIHGRKCNDCKKAFAHTSLIFRETLYDYRRLRALATAKEGRYIASLGWRLRGIMGNPNWWLRLPQILRRRLGRL
jgi:glycosyltransferase involved in cell wall biosynthesis